MESERIELLILFQKYVNYRINKVKNGELIDGGMFSLVLQEFAHVPTAPIKMIPLLSKRIYTLLKEDNFLI